MIIIFHPSRPLCENQRKQKEIQVLKTEKTVKHEADGDTNCNWRTWNCPQRLGKRSGRAGNQKTNRNHPDVSIFEISQYTEKRPRDLKRLSVALTPVKTIS